MMLFALAMTAFSVEETTFLCPMELPEGAKAALHRSGEISPDADHPSINLASPTSKIINVDMCIEVGVDGRPSTCDANSPSQYFSKLSCKLAMRRFRYFPATDTAGLAIRSFVTSNIRWETNANESILNSEIP